MSLNVWLNDDEEGCVWGANITHNVGKIAREAGFYECIWQADTVGIEFAKGNITHLRSALGAFYSDYDKLAKLNPENGWGSIDGLIDFTKNYLDACIKHPNARISIHR